MTRDPAPTPPSVEALRTIEARAMDALYHRRDCAQWDSIHDCDCGLTSSLAKVEAAARSEVYAWVAQNEAKVHAERTRLSGITHHEGDGCEGHP